MTAFPLKVGPTGRYLVDQNGVPFQGRGESPWELATTLNATDQATYLTDRAKRGFNMFLIQAIDNIFNANGTGQNAFGHMPFNTQQGGGSYTNSTTQSPNFNDPNSSFLADLDASLNRVPSSSLILFYPTWIGNPPLSDPGSEGYDNTMSAQATGVGGHMYNWGVTLASRYGPGGSNPLPNLIWGIGGDYTPHIAAENTDIIAGIQSVDTSHLFYVDGLDGDSMINRWGSNSWFGCNGIYSDSLIGHPWLYAQCKSEYQNTSGLQTSYPQFFKEGGYEFGQTGWTEQFVRGQNWQAMLGGCWGYCLGVNGVWQFSGGWQSLLSSVASVAAQVLNAFLMTRPTSYLLVPDWNNVFLTNGGSYTNANFASAAYSSDGTWGCCYVPVNESLTFQGSLFERKISAQWMDPTNGATQAVKGSPFTNNGTFTISATPGNNAQGDPDWVIVFDLVGAGAQVGQTRMLVAR